MKPSSPSPSVKLHTLEVVDVKPLAATLFKKSFADNIPDFPKHFLLMAVAEKGWSLTLGYVHFSHHHSIYLGGGMCINTAAIRQLPNSVRQQIKRNGGLAFTMLSSAVKKLTDAEAVFGYVGHKGAYKIDLAVGFEPTQFPHLIVHWQQELSEDRKQQLIEQANDHGPF